MAPAVATSLATPAAGSARACRAEARSRPVVRDSGPVVRVSATILARIARWRATVASRFSVLRLDFQPTVTDSNGTYYEPSSRPPTWANSLREIVSSRSGELFNASVPTKGFGWFDGLGAKLPDNGHDRFDLAVFMLGTNDRLQDPEVLTESVSSVIDKAMATSDSVVVVIPEPVCYVSLHMVGQVLCSVCEEKGVPTIDALALFERIASMAGYSNSDLYSDGVHLSTSGQIVLWSIVSNGLGIW